MLVSFCGGARLRSRTPGITLPVPELPLRLKLHKRYDLLKLSNNFGRSRRQRIWYGDLDRHGAYDPRTDQAPNVATILRAFARDPVGLAQNHGERTGYCCFCLLPLTDEERSLNFGYGPICAKPWGLPWGKVAKVEKPQAADRASPGARSMPGPGTSISMIKA